MAMSSSSNGTGAGAGPKERELDVVLFGATGFTGRLVAEYLARAARGLTPPLRWALAGRSRDKLERVRAEIAAGHETEAAAGAEIILVDARDRAALEAMAARTRAVATTVGPYGRYGSALVAACAEAGIGYADLTGEVFWMREMIDAHHGRAVASGARIVHTCGFDSIPSDLGVLMLHDHLARRGDRLVAAKGRLIRARGGMSGGTVASGMDMGERMKDPAVRRLLADPYALNPGDERHGPDGPDLMRPRRDPDDGHWQAPFMMAPVNTRVVRRSNALLDFGYGRDFRYDETFDMGPGPRGLERAVVVSAAMGAMGLALSTGIGRRLASRLLPAPGQGPDRATRESGCFRIEIHGQAQSGARLVGVVAAERDPGYGATAIMMGESALCLARDALPERAGVLTPAAAMGMQLVERLRAAGMTFAIEE